MRHALAFLLILVASLALVSTAQAHRSGCHRWHSCPSDTGSYVCGDLGYSTYCPKRPATKPNLKPAPDTKAKTITGKPRFIDGDTIVISGDRIRLHGIDAPESRQTCTVDGKEWACGHEATQALAFETAEHLVRCEAREKDRYG